MNIVKDENQTRRRQQLLALKALADRATALAEQMDSVAHMFTELVHEMKEQEETES